MCIHLNTAPQKQNDLGNNFNVLCITGNGSTLCI